MKSLHAEKSAEGIFISDRIPMNAVETSAEPHMDNARGNASAQKQVFTFWRGRVALFAILKALGVGADDSVVVPAFTCFAVPSAVVFTGAMPIYADIESDTFNLSLATIEAALSREKNSGNVKAILVQHTFGIPADAERITQWAHERGIAVIEDCAHAFGSRCRNACGEWQELGSFGDAAFFSSQWTKPVSTGLGGWAEVRNPALAAKVQQFRDQECRIPSLKEIAALRAQVLVRKLFRSQQLTAAAKRVYQALYSRGLLAGTSSPEELRGGMPVGYAKRMSRFQERLLRKNLRNREIQEHRRNLKAIYDQALPAAGFAALRVPESADSVLLRYPVRVANKAEVLKQAARHGIEIGDWYCGPVDLPESMPASAAHYAQGTCPEGEKAARETINLPLNANTSEGAARRAVEFLREIAIPAN